MSDLIPPQKEPTGAPRVEILNFSKRFGLFQALQDVSLTVGPAPSMPCSAKTAPASRRW